MVFARRANRLLDFFISLHLRAPKARELARAKPLFSRSYSI
jgi:hypothetical protein